jgi:hypothetical protein
MRGGGSKSSGLIPLKTSSSGGSAAGGNGGNGGNALRRGGEVRMRWDNGPANAVRPARSASRMPVLRWPLAQGALGCAVSGGDSALAGTGRALRAGLRVGEVMMNGGWPKGGGGPATAARRSLRKRGRVGPLQRSSIIG